MTAGCACPGCVRTERQTTMYMEYMDIDEVWVKVCEKHVDKSNPTREI